MFCIVLKHNVMEALMRSINSICIAGVLLVCGSSLAMQEVRTFKAGPVRLINKSEHQLGVEVRLAKNYGTAVPPQTVNPNQSLTISSLKAITNPQEGHRAMQAQDEGAYEILVHVPKKLGQQQPLAFPIGKALDKIQECTRTKNTQEISALIAITPKTGVGFTGMYTYYSLQVTFVCGSYEPALEKEWQVMGPEGGIKEEINLEDIGMQPMLFEDIVTLHPGWQEKQAREFYQSLVTTSQNEAKIFDEDFRNFAGKTPQENNSLKQRFNQVVALAKKNNFLESTARIENNTATDTTSSVIFDFSDGYIHFISSKYLKGPRNERRLRTYVEQGGSPILQTIGYDLAKGYKIHLMPKQGWQPLLDVTDRLLTLFTQNPELQNIVSEFKIRLAPVVAGPTKNKVIMPIIVIYIFTGKDDTQKVLNILYESLKDIPGLGIPPRYNAIINDLIYVAQGSGEDKGGRFSKYYEQPRQAYYRSDITGSPQDYHLKHPATGAEVK
jgi:hypothetical protein